MLINLFNQRLPRHGSISDFRLLAELQSLFGARLGSRPAFGVHSRYPVPAQRLDEKGYKYDTGEGLTGWVQCSVNLVHLVLDGEFLFFFSSIPRANVFFGK